MRSGFCSQWCCYCRQLLARRQEHAVLHRYRVLQGRELGISWTGFYLLLLGLILIIHSRNSYWVPTTSQGGDSESLDEPCQGQRILQSCYQKLSGSRNGESRSCAGNHRVTSGKSWLGDDHVHGLELIVYTDWSWLYTQKADGLHPAGWGWVSAGSWWERWDARVPVKASLCPSLLMSATTFEKTKELGPTTVGTLLSIHRVCI